MSKLTLDQMRCRYKVTCEERTFQRNYEFLLLLPSSIKRGLSSREFCILRLGDRVGVEKNIKPMEWQHIISIQRGTHRHLYICKAQKGKKVLSSLRLSIPVPDFSTQTPNVSRKFSAAAKPKGPISQILAACLLLQLRTVRVASCMVVCD